MKEQTKLRGADFGFDGSYLGTFSRHQALAPEQALLLAVLEDAIHCFRKYGMARSRAGRKRFTEVENWILRKREDWIFDFENICEILSLDPGYVRRGLVRWKDSASASSRRKIISYAHRLVGGTSVSEVRKNGIKNSQI